MKINKSIFILAVAVFIIAVMMGYSTWINEQEAIQTIQKTAEADYPYVQDGYNIILLEYHKNYYDWTTGTFGGYRAEYLYYNNQWAMPAYSVIYVYDFKGSLNKR